MKIMLEIGRHAGLDWMDRSGIESIGTVAEAAVLILSEMRSALLTWEAAGSMADAGTAPDAYEMEYCSIASGQASAIFTAVTAAAIDADAADAADADAVAERVGTASAVAAVGPGGSDGSSGGDGGDGSGGAYGREKNDDGLSEEESEVNSSSDDEDLLEIDRPVSGPMLKSKTADANALLCLMLSDDSIRYRALNEVLVLKDLGGDCLLKKLCMCKYPPIIFTKLEHSSIPLAYIS